MILPDRPTRFLVKISKNLNFLILRLGQFFVYTCVNPHQNKKLPPTKILMVKPNGYMNEQGTYIKGFRDVIDPNFPISSKKF
jgi:hypothetical protein